MPNISGKRNLPLELDQHALVCPLPLQRPPVMLHLGCAQRLENGRFLFPIRRFGTLFLQTYATSRTVLI